MPPLVPPALPPGSMASLTQPEIRANGVELRLREELPYVCVTPLNRPHGPV
ncbi:hypothetical protein [Planotetraspora sp. GP83]|uniref:hypothetical protein n=1 Tax=Planotetraspora sp. GP83 TaxID=3156264 RepID=UPI0035194665